MAEDITLDEEFRRLDVALDKLQRAVEARAGVSDNIFDDVLEAAQNYRSDTQYKALVVSADSDSDRIL
jgi:hypothetical protein